MYVLAGVEEEVGNSCKWTVGHARQREEVREWVFIEHLLWFHTAFRTFTYNLSVTLTTPTRWVFPAFYRGGNRVLETRNNMFRIPSQYMDQLGCCWTNPGLTLQLLVFTLCYTDSLRIRKADPHIRRAAMRAIIYSYLPLLAPGWCQRPGHTHTWTMGVPQRPKRGWPKCKQLPHQVRKINHNVGSINQRQTKIGKAVI